MKFEELKTINVKEDPVRPELDLEFRLSHGKKIFGLKQLNDEIIAIVCLTRSFSVPTNVIELSAQTNSRGENLIAYSLWSNKRGAGTLLIDNLKLYAKKENVKRFLTMSPLTKMARNFHLKNGAKEFQVNKESVNFEYIL